MSGIVLSKQIEWRADYAPTSSPTLNELLITLRTLHYYSRRCAKQNGSIKPYLTECIGFIERSSPKEIQNIINLMYNS